MSKDKNFILSKIFDKLSIKEEELLRPIVPVEQWVTDEYYVGKDGLKLYPFWRGVIKDIFESGSQYNQVVLDGGLGCTPLTTRKRTSKGYLSLLDIKDQLSNKEHIYIKTESGVEPIKDVHFIGRQKIKILHFADGSIYECTENHLFRTLIDGEIQWIRADQLKPNDSILRTATSNLFPEKNQSFEGKYAYTIGYFIGDGDYRTTRNSIRIVYADHKYSTESYSYVLEQMRELSGTHHVNVYENYSKLGKKPTGHTHRRFTAYNVNNSDMFILCGLDAYNKHIPDYVNLFTREEVCLLIAGLFDSDGCVENASNRINISFSSRNQVLVSQIQNLLFNLGISSVVKIQDRIKSEKGIDYRLRIQDFYSIQKFYDLIPLKVRYKKEKIESYIRGILSTKDYNRTSKSLRIHGVFNTLYDFCKKSSLVKLVNIAKKKPSDISLGKLRYIQEDLGVSLDTSKSLSYLYKNQCYSTLIDSIEDSETECGDIEVEGSHTYISDGIINHNTGKSTCGVFIMLRKLYEISCYKSIQGKFHLMDSALIVFLYFSLSKFQAKRTGFKQFKDTVDSIPYFTENFPRDIKANDELRFPSNVYYLYGTGTGDAIGSNMLCSLIDEGNFFGNSSGDSTDYSEVADLHRALVARQASRFLRNGKNESLSIVISSNTYKSSYTEELRKRALTDPSIKCYRARSWDVKPKGTFSDQYFYVFCGTDKVDPFIIEEPFDLISKLNLRLDPNQTVKEAINKLPVDLRNLVDEVPEDLREHYVVNIVKALQDFSGFSVESTNTLFNNRNVFNACIDDSVPSLFTKTEFVIETMNDQPQNTIMYYLSGRPFPHPDRPRFLHVDLGLSTDACGIACCYQSGVKMVDGIERPTYSFDFSLRIVPPPAPKKISIARTEEFLIYLRDKLHLQIGMISWDQFQSSSSQQRLQELGFPVRYQSVDRTDKAYLYFVENLYLNCVTFNAQFADDIQHELFNLIHDRKKGKVDHPSDTAHGGMKDRMDAIVGAMYNAFECKPPEVCYNDTLSLSFYNDENSVPFTEDSMWLFDTTPRSEQIQEIVEQEYREIIKNMV